MSVFKTADILIPRPGTDFGKWSVVACDQYTSEPEYWEKVKSIVGDSPSTLNMILPEVYLNDGDADVEKINDTMRKYLKNGVFEELRDSYVYVERTQSDGKIRHGIVGAVDLEEYDFTAGSGSKIRATEGTILSRIPPRQRIRRGAPIELTHILMLIDDKENSVFLPLDENKADFRKLYDFDLMCGSGHLTGYLVSDEIKAEINSAIAAIADEKQAAAKENGTAALVLAVGDGNHSLATAKSCWEEIKQGLSDSELENHPARYALVELVNLYDDAMQFEPIHRVVFDVNPEHMLSELEGYFKGLSRTDNGGQYIKYTYAKGDGDLFVADPLCGLPIGTIQSFIDYYIEKYGGRVDYIHGEDVVKRLAKQDGCIGFIVAAMDKNDLYPTVIKDSSLPRKTFSMGEAADKRFYLEGKKIKIDD